jgi:hypothetical protein
MKPAEFAKYLARDIYCPHCGRQDDTLVIQHRISRGMGGSKRRNQPSNLLVMCSEINGLLESSALWASTGRRFGWKLESWEDSEFAPVYDYVSKTWSMLDNNMGRAVLLNHDFDD